MILTFADIEIAARTVWAEARGEGYAGQYAVACVLKNRLQSNKGVFARDDTLATACLRHLQFSAWTREDPNFRKMQTVSLDDPKLLQCLGAVVDALNSELDTTHGSLHYHAVHILTPKWAKGHEPVAQIGGHLFYNDIP